MKFFVAFATGLSLIAHAQAACPTVDEIRAWLRTNVQNVDKTVFYTSPSSTSRDAQFYAQKIGGKYWGNVYPNEQYLDWLGECGVGSAQDDLAPRMSEALAAETSDSAYIMLKKGVAPQPNSIFMKYEYPKLAGRVPVYVVNPADLDETQPWTPGTNWKRAVPFGDFPM
ncbi:hypothetical protein F4677DRAFT_84213 [Hypoxylon crocopeplum]|nr:hypothetical protein F4677DRAFT_84213 [Hypoxylon crocopeplum]